ncbi:guanine deaminase [Solimonas marina]|uniref:Guanine deaminase n=1 Tax=Solimonas marina TaxID=2714601 RepID=A0A969WCX8_9GAMM|nr:guanine deaminase [Solimonas marina]NKF24239.1 guanine deaminase [Solimonas marina]
MSASLQAHRGAVLYFTDDPRDGDGSGQVVHHEDGLLVVEHGRVQAVGPADALLATLPADITLIDHGSDLLMPGLIDTHIHFPQTEVIGSGGRQLLDWLDDYVFAVERRFGDPAYAREVAEVFLDELLRNGTTTALVFCTVHKTSVDAFFAAAARRGLRMIAGKVLMDRNCPEYLRDTADDGARETRELIEAWHGTERLSVAITPRFAPTSTPEQLAAAGRLAAEYPSTYIHSHLAENPSEIAWVRELFPERRSYLDVYDHYGLLRERAVYAHAIHLDQTDRRRMADCGACAAHSPTSNLYLGSGLFDFDASDAAGLRFGVATDVGGGTSFSMLRTLGEAYKVAQMKGQRLTPLRAFYLATLGNARILQLQDRIGTFAPGSEADFIAVDLQATPLLARRLRACRTLSEKLLVLMTLGDERAVRQTYIGGNEAVIHDQNES